VKPAVFDASPVIILAKAGHFDLIPQLVEPAFIPRTVVDEIDAGSPGDPAIKYVARAGWLTTVEPATPLSPIATWRLGPGETEVLEYARQNVGTIAVLDDKAARRAAQALQIPYTGTLGLLLAAVEKELLPSITKAMDDVKHAGLYIDPVVEAALIKKRSK
jgi:predicted nucleic acid-binding protein